MRAFIQFVFVALYALSSYSTAHSRVAYFANELQHSTGRAATVVLDDGCKAKPLYTNFREARKAGQDYSQPIASRPSFNPMGTWHGLHTPIATVTSFAGDIDSARAPPVRVSISSI